MDIGNDARDLHGGRYGSDPQAILALVQSRIVRVISRFLFFAVLLLLVPYIGPILKEQSSVQLFDAKNLHSFVNNQFSEFINELETAGILKEGQRSLILIAGPIADAPIYYADHLRSMGADIVIDNNFWQQGPFANESFEIAFMSSQFGSGFIDRVLKTGGTVVLPVKDLSSNVFLDRFHYRCTFTKPYDFESIILALVKPSPPNHTDGVAAAG